MVQLVLLQEVNMTERDVSHFCDKACRKGWAAYHVLGAHSTRAGDDSRVGGVATLVSICCESMAWKPNFGGGGHAPCTQVGAMTVMNCYARHHGERNPFLQNVFELDPSSGTGMWSQNLLVLCEPSCHKVPYPQDGSVVDGDRKE